MNNLKVRILDIIKGTTVDGPGFRTSIYFAGCRHFCPGCHNPQSWDFQNGVEMTLDQIMAIIKEEDFDVTLTGGDPLFHPEIVKELSRLINITGHNVWLYTGFTYEEIIADPILKDSIHYIDTIVDGRYIDSLRDPDLLFRGSSNQRIIKL